jgi:hypothetical protein
MNYNASQHLHEATNLYPSTLPNHHTVITPPVAKPKKKYVPRKYKESIYIHGSAIPVPRKRSASQSTIQPAQAEKIQRLDKSSTRRKPPVYSIFHDVEALAQSSSPPSAQTESITPPPAIKESSGMTTLWRYCMEQRIKHQILQYQHVQQQYQYFVSNAQQNSHD